MELKDSSIRTKTSVKLYVNLRESPCNNPQYEIYF